MISVRLSTLSGTRTSILVMFNIAADRRRTPSNQPSLHPPSEYLGMYYGRGSEITRLLLLLNLITQILLACLTWLASAALMSSLLLSSLLSTSVLLPLNHPLSMNALPDDPRMTENLAYGRSNILSSNPFAGLNLEISFAFSPML